jgi:hypothetical protein
MEQNEFDEPTENDKELTAFVVDHCDRWRVYRDTNFLTDWEEYERIFRGQWAIQDKTRDSERSRIVTPATQQAVETRNAEIMEAIFGSGAKRRAVLAFVPSSGGAPERVVIGHNDRAKDWVVAVLERNAVTLRRGDEEQVLKMFPGKDPTTSP